MTKREKELLTMISNLEELGEIGDRIIKKQDKIIASKDEIIKIQEEMLIIAKKQITHLKHCLGWSGS